MELYDLNNDKNPILEIQRILRNLDQEENDLARVKPDGVFGEDTTSAVARFQSKYGLSATGVVDKATWDLLHTIENIRIDENTIPRSIYIMPKDNQFLILPGARENLIYVIQHMLNEIGQDHDDIGEIAINGVYDAPSVNAVKILQRKSLMADDGIINGKVFNMLADEYERINNRSI